MRRNEITWSLRHFQPNRCHGPDLNAVPRIPLTPSLPLSHSLSLASSRSPSISFLPFLVFSRDSFPRKGLLLALTVCPLTLDLGTPLQPISPLSRLLFSPFLLSCSLLFFCLANRERFTPRRSSPASRSPGIGNWKLKTSPLPTAITKRNSTSAPNAVSTSFFLSTLVILALGRIVRSSL
jgi:hypothetical protein